MTSVLTTMIQSISIDRSFVEQRFRVYRVNYGAYPKGEEANRRLSTLAQEIYTAGSVYSLLCYRRETSFYVLQPAIASLALKDPKLSVQAVDVYAMPNWILARLMIKALPSVLADQPSDTERFEAEGLYYLVKQKKVPKTDAPMLVTVEIDLAPQAAASSGQMLKVFVRTFVPLDSARMADGQLSKKDQVRSRFRLDKVQQLAHKSVHGEYIKRSLSRKRKNRVAMIDLRDESYDNYQQSRSGVLHGFMKDIEAAYGPALQIELERLASDRHDVASGKEVEAAYRAIHQVLREYPMAVVDHGEDPCAVPLLIGALHQLGFHAELSDEPVEGNSNLLIVKDKDTYRDNIDEDPYQVLKRAYPKAVIQACYPENLINEREEALKSFIVDVLLKELLIKWEVKHGIQLLDGYDIPAGILFVLPYRLPSDHEVDDFDSKDDWIYLGMERWDAKLVFKTIDNDQLNDILLDVEDKYLCDLITGGDYQRTQRFPFAYWPPTGDIMIFADTEALILPEFQVLGDTLRDLKMGRAHRIPGKWLHEFIESYPKSKIVPVLKTMLDESLKDDYEYDDLNSRIKYKSADEKAFYEWLRAKLGSPIKVSLRSRDSRYINGATRGFFINRQKGLYFAGGTEAPQAQIGNFCHLYRIHSTLPKLPEEIERLFSALYIRHKQHTVYPLHFKYLREFGAEMTLLS